MHKPMDFTHVAEFACAVCIDLSKEISRISLPVADPKSDEFEMREYPIIEPHNLMHVLMTSIGIDIPHERVRDYWRTHRDLLKEDWATNSPATPEHIPFALYGDGAKIKDDGTKIVGIFVSLPAVWRPRSSRCARWCVFALEEHKLYGHHTLTAVFRRLTYSCNLLFNGLGPTGNRLCNGRVFTVTEIKGDWQWLKVSMRFRSSWQNVDSVCFLCDAKARCDHDPSKLHYCANENPGWTSYTLTTFLADQMTMPDPCYLIMPGKVFLYMWRLFFSIGPTWFRYI